MHRELNSGFEDLPGATMDVDMLEQEQMANDVTSDFARPATECSASTRSSEDNPICWICLDFSAPLVFPCKCPRAAHPACLARWQLQSAGTRKETHCEFCDETLPDWKESLTPTCGSQAPALMNVNFDGRTYSFEVKPGPDGYAQFTAAIRRAFNLPDDKYLANSLLTLQGPGAYDAAVHCASVSAARRLSSPFAGGSQLGPEDMQTGDGMGTPTSQQGHGTPVGGPSEGAESTVQVGPGPVTPGGKRRLTGFGRKLRTAIADLLSPRSVN